MTLDYETRVPLDLSALTYKEDITLLRVVGTTEGDRWQMRAYPLIGDNPDKATVGEITTGPGAAFRPALAAAVGWVAEACDDAGVRLVGCTHEPPGPDRPGTVRLMLDRRPAGH